MKINKACDLSSISVLPPQARRSNVASKGAESSIFGRSKAAAAAATQLRSQQQSQQSFSQGVSSQPGIFSQLSQNSADDFVINDQRFGTQERENSQRLSLLLSNNNTREENQNQISRSSKKFVCKWNAPDQRNQISEECEYRIGMMETSLSRFGMILDSVQNDIMQVNKGRKELALEMESIRQKLNTSDNTLQLMNKGQEDVKVSLDRDVNSICDQLSKYAYQELSHDMFSLVTALPEKIELCMQKLKNDLCRSFAKEMQEMACSLQILDKKLTSTVHLSKDISHRVTPQERPSDKNTYMQASQPMVQKETAATKIEMGTCSCVKPRQDTSQSRPKIVDKQRGISPVKQEKVQRINIQSDEETNQDFFCIREDKETGTGIFSMQQAQEETERILRKARRRKRKHNNTIIIN